MLVAHAFNPSTREAEVGGSLSLRPAWSTKASSRTGHITHRSRDHVGHEDPGCLCKLPECLVAHTRRNLEVPATGWAKHSDGMLATLGGGNGKRYSAL